MLDCGSCERDIVGLVLLSVALFISVFINVIFCIKRRTNLCRDPDECWLTHICTTECSSENEGHSFHFDVAEQQENPQLEENPIYGNINLDRRDSVDACHEIMTMQHAGDHTEKPSQPNLNYASLNLKMAKKGGKKTRHQPSPSQGGSRDEPPEGEADARLPSRDAVLSHSSIYLNSQQIAQEAEEKERDAQWDGVGREGIRQREDGRSAKWEGEQGSEERQRRGDSNGALLEAFHSGSSFHK